jgi:hypothetical protein
LISGAAYEILPPGIDGLLFNSFDPGATYALSLSAGEDTQ